MADPADARADHRADNRADDRADDPADDPAPPRLARLRAALARRPTLRLAYRIGVGLVGGLVLAAGILLIPYPGPGWLVVFGGLGILATEFGWARRLLTAARARYAAWTGWLRRQSWAVKVPVLAVTGAAVVLTLWVLGSLGLVADVLGPRWTWLRSPVF